MAKITFDKDFNWVWGNGRMTTAYKAGSTYIVKRECADEAIGKGAATEGSGVRKASAKTAVTDGESTD